MSNTPKTVRVRVAASPERGLFRAGRHWPREQTEADVTPEQLEQLKAEPRIAVLEIPPEKPAKGEKAEKPAETPKQ